MDVVTKLLAVVGAFIEGFIGWISTGITSVVEIFYVAESGFTFIGVLALFGIGVGVVTLIINFVKSMVQK